MAAGLGLALTQPQHLGHAQAQCQLVQGVLLDQVGPHAREIAFRQRPQALVQQTRHREVQDGVPQKFEPLVVVGREAAVRGGALQQGGVGKGVLQAVLQRKKTRRHYLVCPSKR